MLPLLKNWQLCIATVLIYICLPTGTVFWSDPNPPTLAHSAHSYVCYRPQGPEVFGRMSGRGCDQGFARWKYHRGIINFSSFNGEAFVSLEYSRAQTDWDVIIFFKNWFGSKPLVPFKPIPRSNFGSPGSKNGSKLGQNGLKYNCWGPVGPKWLGKGGTNLKQAVGHRDRLF